MNSTISTYSPTTLTETSFGNLFFDSFTDEENASGFFNSKAQRERFAEYHDFPISHSSKQDSESGYHYFGARYYDSELLTGWLSVDPMVDKYPSINPYAYCAWTRPTGGAEHRWIKYNTVNNPVKLVDENGMEFGDFYNEQGKLIGSDGHTDGKKYLLKMVQLKPWEMDTEADNSDFGINKQERIDTEKII